MHWKEEGISNKQAELAQVLHSKDVSVCCIQETRLQEDKNVKVRGYQWFRSDAQDRHKRSLLTLVRNNISSCEVKTHLKGPEDKE